mmetsp:Transcript_38821/g.95982  ORF Transcript_38821/g.95982 Transcript_38821/m.95982 type:complete len:225 (-) Transcript_38821:1209-1883(-)
MLARCPRSSTARCSCWTTVARQTSTWATTSALLTSTSVATTTSLRARSIKTCWTASERGTSWARRCRSCRISPTQFRNGSNASPTRRRTDSVAPRTCAWWSLEGLWATSRACLLSRRFVNSSGRSGGKTSHSSTSRWCLSWEQSGRRRRSRLSTPSSHCARSASRPTSWFVALPARCKKRPRRNSQTSATCPRSSAWACTTCPTYTACLCCSRSRESWTACWRS